MEGREARERGWNRDGVSSRVLQWKGKEGRGVRTSFVEYSTKA